jgi:hypothetical protein
MAEASARSLELAERVAVLANGIGIATALIGAAAMAVHKYVRATRDLDLASNVDPTELRRLQERLELSGLHTELRLPDEEDVLGGVLVVWERTDEEGDPLGAIEIVNFANPHRAGHVTPAADAVRNATPIDASSPLRCVQLGDLIALKLYAGSFRDKADVIDLLKHNPDADLDAVRAVCSRFGFADTLDELIAASSTQ